MSKLLRIFNRHIGQPNQISHRHYSLVAFCGRVGFFAKAFIYTFIGGLILDSAVSDTVHNESPQGVFVFLGSAPQGTSYLYLILILSGIVIYAIWRYWEGLSGQGYDSNFSKKKNFFKYRVSPLASAIVYTLYAGFVISLFFDKPEPGTAIRDSDETCFPVCWRNSIHGIIGLVLLAVAFSIATITQLIPSLTGNFINEMNMNIYQTNGKSLFKQILRWFFLITGHIGFLARAVFFLLVAFLFWNILFGNKLDLDPSQATVGQAVNSIREYMWGRAVMGLLGTGLIIYGIFAVQCCFVKIFPTPPPTDNTTVETTS